MAPMHATLLLLQTTDTRRWRALETLQVNVIIAAIRHATIATSMRVLIGRR
jgi:hypothetical protein